VKFVDVFHNLFDYEFKTKVIIPLLIAMLWLLYSCEWGVVEHSIKEKQHKSSLKCCPALNEFGN